MSELVMYPPAMIIFGLICFAVAFFLVMCGSYWRDREWESIESHALWKAVPFQHLGHEDSEIFLILPDRFQKSSAFVIQNIRHEEIGSIQKSGKSFVMTLFDHEWTVSLPGSGRDSQEISRSFGDSILFWESGLVAGEILPISDGNPKQVSVVTSGREYEVSIPKTSERQCASVFVDGEVIAEFARADRLAIGRARLLAIRGEDQEHLLPMLIWLAIYR